MSQSLSDILVHVVFSTKERRSMIQPSIETNLYQYIAGICGNLNSPLIEINGMTDHIHLLLLLGKTIPVSKLIQEIKANSSKWIKFQDGDYKNFSWQNGYAIFSLSRSNIVPVRRYILKQKEKHRIISFKDELLMMLQRAEVKYDEKYLWD